MASQSYQLSFGFSLLVFIVCLILAVLTVALLIKAFGVIAAAFHHIASTFSGKDSKTGDVQEREGKVLIKEE